jgi:hypothetical protein
VRLRVTGTDALRGAESRVVARTRTWLQGVLRLYRDTVKELSPVATGAFKRSIFYRTKVRGAELTGFVGSSLPEAQANAVENGRAPGKMPPSAPIRAWMQVRGIDARAEWPIRKKIAEQGTKGSFPFARAARKNRGILRTRVRDLEVRLGRDIV